MSKIGPVFKNLKNFTEEPITKRLFNCISPAKKRGYLSKKEFLMITKWKSPRPLRHYKKNSNLEIVTATRLAIETKSEKDKILNLTSLHGIGIPSASALLTLIDPNRYGIIDIRVWQALYHFNLVHDNKNGKSLTIKNWLEYLAIIRKLATKYHTSPRIIEQTLFRYHKGAIQRGNLY